VSRTITDLVVGSGLAFEPRGSEELKGVPGEWQLFAVAAERSPAERRLAEIEIGKPRESQRSTDRLAAAVARRSPGAIRAAFRLDPRYRRARKAAD
jgi:hypothetical protein